jgi:hypothetical protein
LARTGPDHAKGRQAELPGRDIEFAGLVRAGRELCELVGFAIDCGAG